MSASHATATDCRQFEWVNDSWHCQASCHCRRDWLRLSVRLSCLTLSHGLARAAAIVLDLGLSYRVGGLVRIMQADELVLSDVHLGKHHTVKTLSPGHPADVITTGNNSDRRRQYPGTEMSRLNSINYHAWLLLVKGGLRINLHPNRAPTFTVYKSFIAVTSFLK